MSSASAAVSHGPRSRTDHELVAACLGGDEYAWAELIDRYKKLIFSVPLRQGVPRQDAVDLFQAVCLDLVAELPRLRDPQALPHWLIQIASHRTTKWRHQQRQTAAAGQGQEPDVAGSSHDMPDALLRELEQEQALRAAIDVLPPRCRQMVQMLFLETPPRSYRDVAAQLGLAEGSIGFIRQRCLQRLRIELRKAGL
jgi:RNA polymerase sigma factor (sigma-70 family)